MPSQPLNTAGLSTSRPSSETAQPGCYHSEAESFEGMLDAKILCYLDENLETLFIHHFAQKVTTRLCRQYRLGRVALQAT